MKKQELKGASLLFIAALFWGTTFVAQSLGMDYVGPFTYLWARSIVGGIVLIPVALLYQRYSDNDHLDQSDLLNSKIAHKKYLLYGGIICGIVLFAASALQQFGMLYTSVGKTGFITALYIVIVPIMGIFLKKKCGINVWISVLIAIAGLYLLCVNESFSISKGDLLVFACSILFATHIIVIDHFSPKVNGVLLSCIQFWVCSVFSGIAMFLIEKPTVASISSAAGAILYAGIFSSGVAFTCQIVGQKHVKPAIAALIMSLESVVSVLAGWLVLHETLSTKELIGCLIMFCAIIFAQIQLPSRKQLN
ncbi:MAG: DMT family transporter [Lachnospiraceae bacterium]|mgnify:FL=1|nr:DMT family transporter [Lachnospiraceae bacterium]